MEQIDNAPQPNWAEMGWTIHRLPARTDANSAGNVWVPRQICKPTSDDTRLVNYQTIVPGQPWHSEYAQADQPAPATPDQFAALEQRVMVVENTMRQLLSESRFRLVVEPR